MEQFNLEEYKKNPSRKVVTRDGREVEILKTNRKDGVHPIIFTLIDPNGIEQVHLCNEQGVCTTLPRPNKFDLFFADEEELTEFEKEISNLINFYGNEVEETTITNAGVKEIASKLLDLARKELISESSYFEIFEKGFKEGEKYALKDLPKWKKGEPPTATKLYVIRKGYYTEFDELDKLFEMLPKEE